jgi:hypothetical protein
MTGTGGTDGSRIPPPPAAAPLEPVPFDTLKRGLDIGSLFALFMELAKSQQQTHHLALGASFREQEEMKSYNDESRKLGKSAAQSTYTAESSRAYGDMAAGTVEVGLAKKGLNKSNEADKDASMIAAGKKQIRANDSALAEAERKMQFESDRLTKGHQITTQIEQSQNKIAAAQAKLGQLEKKEQDQRTRMRDAKTAGRHADYLNEHKELKKVQQQKAKTQAEMDAETDNLAKAVDEKNALRPKEVTEAQNKLDQLHVERADLQAKHDAIAPGRPSKTVYANALKEQDALIKKQEDVVAAKVAEAGWVPRDKETPDGFSNELHEKQNDMAQFRQKTREKNQAVVDSTSHLDPHTKGMSVQLWTQLGQGFSAPMRGSANLSAAGAERDGSIDQTEAKYADGMKEISQQVYERQNSLQQNAYDLYRSVLDAWNQISQSTNQLSTDTYKNV